MYSISIYKHAGQRPLLIFFALGAIILALWEMFDAAVCIWPLKEYQKNVTDSAAYNLLYRVITRNETMLPLYMVQSFFIAIQVVLTYFYLLLMLSDLNAKICDTFNSTWLQHSVICQLISICWLNMTLK